MGTHKAIPIPSTKVFEKILRIVAFITSVTLPITLNIGTLAQTPSTLPNRSGCSEVEINRHIQQLKQSDVRGFDGLVGCGSRSVPALIGLLNNLNEQHRIIAIAALGEIGKPAAAAVPELEKMLQDNNPDIRLVTVDALGKIRIRTIPILIKTLDDEDESVQSATRDALIKIGKPALPLLIKHLESGSWESRLMVADVLGVMKENAKQATPAMIRTFGESIVANIENNSDICPYYFSFILKDINKDRNSRLNEIKYALKSLNWRVRVGAIALLSEDASYDNSIPLLTRFILDESEDVRVRYTAAMSLTELKDPSALSILNKYKKLINAIKQESEIKHFKLWKNIFCDEEPATATSTVGRLTASTTKRPLAICKIPTIKVILRWKCPK